MSDEVRGSPPEDVGADTEKFRAFVREGDAIERRQPDNGFRVLSLVGGLLLLAAVIALLLRG